jgi:O-antigen/teichoic acid export membrane protein
VARNVTSLAGGQAVTWTMTLVWTLIVPRALGPTGLGLVVGAMSVSGVLGVLLGLGTRNYLVREIVVDRAGASKLIGTALVTRLLLVPVLAIAVLVIARVAHYGPEQSTVLYLAGAATILTLLAEPMQAGFQAIERMQYLAYGDVINKTAQSLLGIALVLIGFRAIGVMANVAAVAGVVVVLNALWLCRYIPIDLHTSARQVRRMLRNSMAYWAFGLFSMVYLWLDTILIGLLTHSEVVGWYGASTRLFQTLMFIPVMVSTAWLPKLVTAHEEGHDQLLKAARTPLMLVLVVAAPVCAGLAMMATWVIRGLYGGAFGPAVPVITILAFCIPLMYANIMLATVLVAAKRQSVWTWVMAGATLVNLPANLVLIPLAQARWGNGAIGAALGLVLTEIVIVGFGVVIVGRRVFDRAAARRIAITVIASAAMWAAGYAVSAHGPIVTLLAGGATFVAIAAATRLVTLDELRQLVGAIRRRGR